MVPRVICTGDCFLLNLFKLDSMSVCNPCTKANLVPECVTNLTIGTISSVSTNVHVYQKHIGSGRIDRYDVTTDGSGTVTISPSNIMRGQKFEYWVTLANADDIETKETLTINSNTYDCVTVEYQFVADASSGDAETYTNITLKI